MIRSRPGVGIGPDSTRQTPLASHMPNCERRRHRLAVLFRQIVRRGAARFVGSNALVLDSEQGGERSLQSASSVANATYQIGAMSPLQIGTVLAEDLKLERP